MSQDIDRAEVLTGITPLYPALGDFAEEVADIMYSRFESVHTSTQNEQLRQAIFTLGSHLMETTKETQPARNTHIWRLRHPVLEVAAPDMTKVASAQATLKDLIHHAVFSDGKGRFCLVMQDTNGLTLTSVFRPNAEEKNGIVTELDYSFDTRTVEPSTRRGRQPSLFNIAAQALYPKEK